MVTFAECLRVPVAGCLGDQIIGHSRDVHGTLVKMFFKFNLKHIKLNLTGYSIIMNGSGKKFSEKFMVQKII